jgi:hypothetical protein
MRRYLPGLVILVLVAWISPARAQDAARAIIDKAIRAQGGEKKLLQERAWRSMSKGRLEVPDKGWVDFTEEMTVASPGRFRETMHHALGGRKVTLTTVFDGTRVWVRADRETEEVPDKTAAEYNEAAYLMELGRLVSLRGDRYTLERLGETKVSGKPAVGVKVSSKGHRDIRLYFAKDTGLLVKVARRIVNPKTSKEETEERVISEYQEMDGHKVAKKASVFHDGKKILDVEVIDVKFVDRIDDKEFAKP